MVEEVIENTYKVKRQIFPLDERGRFTTYFLHHCRDGENKSKKGDEHKACRTEI